MTTITHVAVPFRGARSGTTRATFAQRGVWGELTVLEPHTQVLNFALQVQVPAGMVLREVLGAIGDLLVRHECLRTRFRPDDRDGLRQELAGEGEFTVEVRDAGLAEDIDAATGDAVDELEVAHHHPGRPVRVLVGTVEGLPILVVLGLSHLVTDMLGARLIRQDMADLLRARASAQPAPALPARRQPLDQATFEQSAAGTGHRVVASWRDRLESAPRTMFPAPPAPEAPQFLHAVLASEALPLAADVLGRRHRVSTAIVVMAAEAILLAHQAGADHCAILVSVGNRTAPDLAFSAGLFRQHSLAVIDLRDASFSEIVRRSWRAWLLAQRTGQYDPGEIAALRRGVELSRGVALDLSCHFNDLRASSKPAMPTATPERIAAAASTFTCERMPAYYAKFQLRLRDEGMDVGRRYQPPPGAPRRVLMHAFADGRVLPEGKLRALMSGIERLLVWQATGAEAAERTIDPQIVSDVTGMPAPACRPGWVRLYGGLVEVAAVERLLAAAAADTCPQEAAVPPLTVLVRPGDGERLVGYLAVRGGAVPTPEQLHRACVARLTDAPPHAPGWPSEAPQSYLPRWLSAVAPQRYVICADVPGVPYDEAGWLTRPVLAEGTGRPCQVTR